MLQLQMVQTSLPVGLGCSPTEHATQHASTVQVANTQTRVKTRAVNVPKWDTWQARTKQTHCHVVPGNTKISIARATAKCVGLVNSQMHRKMQSACVPRRVTLHFQIRLATKRAHPVHLQQVPATRCAPHVQQEPFQISQDLSFVKSVLYSTTRTKQARLHASSVRWGHLATLQVVLPVRTVHWGSTIINQGHLHVKMHRQGMCQTTRASATPLVALELTLMYQDYHSASFVHQDPLQIRPSIRDVVDVLQDTARKTMTHCRHANSVKQAATSQTSWAQNVLGALLVIMLVGGDLQHAVPANQAAFPSVLALQTAHCVLQIRISNHPVLASVNHVPKVMAPKIPELPNVKNVVLVKCRRSVLKMESQAVCYVLLEQSNQKMWDQTAQHAVKVMALVNLGQQNAPSASKGQRRQ